jgi:tRNA(fMet)-specific endonuclease VapC
MYLLDTNSVIYFFKGLGGVAEKLLATPPRTLVLSAVSLYELEVGIARSAAPERRRAQIEQLLAIVDVLPFGEEEARVAARLRSSLERTGRQIGPLDTLIAGTALCHGATVVTRNVREFARIDGLAVENWF